MKKRLDKFLQCKSYIDLESIAADLAAADCEDQALFFNVFFEALKVNCEDPYRKGMQLAYLFELLSNEALSSVMQLTPND